MSTLAYGLLVGRQREASEADALVAEKPENKLVSAIAALVPAEVIAAHALVLGATTKTDESGTTSITDSTALGASLIVLAVAAVIAFFISRGMKNLEGADIVRALIPAFSFVAWAGLIGTSALTPWLTGRVPVASSILISAALAVVLIAVNLRVNPPKPA